MKVLITRPHTHAGTQYTPGPDGLELDLPEHAVDYIERVGAGKRITRAKRHTADDWRDDQQPGDNTPAQPTTTRKRTSR